MSDRRAPETEFGPIPSVSRFEKDYQPASYNVTLPYSPKSASAERDLQLTPAYFGGAGPKRAARFGLRASSMNPALALVGVRIRFSLLRLLDRLIPTPC